MAESARAATAASLQRAGFVLTEATVGERAVTVARSSQFRWSWFASRLHSFVFLTNAVAGDGPEALDRLLVAATNYSIANKGGLPRGLQTGVAVIPVVFGSGLADGVKQWASAAHKRRMGAMNWPVVVDVKERVVYQPGRTWVGVVFVPYFRSLVREHVGFDT